MVGKIVAAMTKPIRGLHEAAYVLAGFSFLSQILALVRDRTFAHLFGAGPVLDSYFAAFRIPDLLFAFLTLFVSSFALVPLLSAREEKAQGVLVGNVLFVFGAVSVAVSAIMWFLIPDLVPLMFSGFPPEQQSDTVMLSRIMLLQPILLGLSSIATSVIQVMRRFIIYALAPVLYNCGIIFGALFLVPDFGVSGLAWGVVLGAILHFGAQIIPLLGHARHMKMPTLESLRESVMEVALPSVPRALALSSQQVLLLVFASIASLTAVGTISALSFASNLQSVPLTIVGISYAAAVFPALAAMFAKKEHEAFRREVWAAIRHIIFWTMPAITLMIVLRAHIVRIILGSGNFTWSDTRLTAAILALFALSLIAQAAILVFSRAYYAARLSAVPILINVGGTALAAGAASAGVWWLTTNDFARHFMDSLFRVSDVPGTAILMIPLAYSGVIILAASLFAYLFSRKFGGDERALGTLATSFASSVLAAAAAYSTLVILGPIVPLSTFLGVLAQALLAGIAGVAVWALTLYLLRSQEFSEVLALIAAKLKLKTGAPQ
jgi:putative peptidoglycan lipid II flippase